MGFYTLYKKQKEYRYMKKTIKRKQKLGIRIGVGCALVITVILLAVQGVSNLTKNLQMRRRLSRRLISWKRKMEQEIHPIQEA